MPDSRRQATCLTGLTPQRSSKRSTRCARSSAPRSAGSKSSGTRWRCSSPRTATSTLFRTPIIPHVFGPMPPHAHTHRKMDSPCLCIYRTRLGSRHPMLCPSCVFRPGALAVLNKHAPEADWYTMTTTSFAPFLPAHFRQRGYTTVLKRLILRRSMLRADRCFSGRCYGPNGTSGQGLGRATDRGSQPSNNGQAPSRSNFRSGSGSCAARARSSSNSKATRRYFWLELDGRPAGFLGGACAHRDPSHFPR